MPFQNPLSRRRRTEGDNSNLGGLTTFGGTSIHSQNPSYESPPPYRSIVADSVHPHSARPLNTLTLTVGTTYKQDGDVMRGSLAGTIASSRDEIPSAEERSILMRRVKEGWPHGPTSLAEFGEFCRNMLKELAKDCTSRTPGEDWQTDFNLTNRLVEDVSRPDATASAV